jgi:hypothetical protein
MRAACNIIKKRSSAAFLQTEISPFISLRLLSMFLAVVMTAGCGRPAETKAPETQSPDAKSAKAEAAEVLPPGVEVVFLGKPGIDLAGPSGVPDGEPDLVIQVTVDARILHEIATWDIQANGGIGYWISTPNPNGWWLIKTEVDPKEKINSDRSVIRLCFTDNGDQKISAFTLRALDRQGTIIIEHTVRK